MASRAFIRANLKGDDVVQQLMRAAPDILRDEETRVVTDLTLALLGRIRAKASGEVIKVDTGKLESGFKPSVRVTKGTVRGRVRNTGVPYFGVINFGGELQARVIEAKNGRALHFMATSGELFAAMVHHPAYKVGRHEVMYSSRDEMADQAQAGIRGAVDVALERARGGH